MRVIPVLDLRRGLAVHARAGRREQYAPVRSRLAPDAEPGDAPALARAYAALGAGEIYVADLNAIVDGVPQWELLGLLAALGPRLLVDAGVATAADAQLAAAAGAARVVVALETLESFEGLAAVGRELGGERLVFGLDLRHGAPVVKADAAHGREPPLRVVERACAAGAGAVIVLDLARVGTKSGVDLTLIGEIRRAFPDLELLAGGGVRDRSDLTRLADAGCDGALVATALHEGRWKAWELGTDIPSPSLPFTPNARDGRNEGGRDGARMTSP